MSKCFFLSMYIWLINRSIIHQCAVHEAYITNQQDVKYKCVFYLIVCKLVGTTNQVKHHLEHTAKSRGSVYLFYTVYWFKLLLTVSFF